MEDVRTRLLRILEVYGISSSEISEDSSYVRDLGMDSLDVMEFVLSVEEEFKVSIPHLEIPNIHTVGQTLDYVQKQLA